MLVDRVHPVQDDDPALLVVEERTTGRMDRALDARTRRVPDRRAQVRHGYRRSAGAVAQQDQHHEQGRRERELVAPSAADRIGISGSPRTWSRSSSSQPGQAGYPSLCTARWTTSDITSRIRPATLYSHAHDNVTHGVKPNTFSTLGRRCNPLEPGRTGRGPIALPRPRRIGWARLGAIGASTGPCTIGNVGPKVTLLDQKRPRVLSEMGSPSPRSRPTVRPTFPSISRSPATGPSNHAAAGLTGSGPTELDVAVQCTLGSKRLGSTCSLLRSVMENRESIRVSLRLWGWSPRSINREWTAL